MDDPANQSQFGKTVALAADQLSGSAAVLLNGRYRGRVSDAGPAIDRPGFYDGCRVENGHIRLFAKEVLTAQEDQAGHREPTC